MKNDNLPWKPHSWRSALADSLSSIDQLLSQCGLSRESVGLGPSGPGETHGFALRVPREFTKRISPGDPLDPILLQILPRDKEAISLPGFDTDPLAEGGGRILRKYSGRILVITTSSCPVHCRYCFRRHFSHAPGIVSVSDIRDLGREDDLREVIFSGGDPLMLGDEKLLPLLSEAAVIPGLKRIRIHSRMPVVLPERIDRSFLDMLGRIELPLVLVVHVNHSREIGKKFHTAMNALRSAGVLLLNQSVLLAGINDDAALQVNLAEKLFDCGVVPYYLHLLDRVRGAAHFEVDTERAMKIHAEMARSLPGYLLPRLVREEPGKASKTPVTPC